MDLYFCIKVLKVKPVYQQMTLSPKLGVVKISTLWHFRLPSLIQMFIKIASSLIQSGIGMHSPILWSHLLKMQMLVLLSSLLWWELGTSSLITGPGEWLSFRRFTSKLSWSWTVSGNRYWYICRVTTCWTTRVWRAQPLTTRSEKKKSIIRDNYGLFQNPVSKFYLSLEAGKLRRLTNAKTEPHRDETNKMACAPSEDSDQPGHPPSLIWVFAVRMKKAWILSYPLSA